MNTEINYKSNPLHGIGLKSLLTEIVDHYGFEILYAYLNINSFRHNPSIITSLKFLKKTDWAREKVEDFYLYKYKNLPKPSHEQSLLSPRDRVIPVEQIPGEPAVLNLEDAERLFDKHSKKSPSLYKGIKPKRKRNRESLSSTGSYKEKEVSPWAKLKNKS